MFNSEFEIKNSELKGGNRANISVITLYPQFRMVDVECIIMNNQRGDRNDAFSLGPSKASAYS